MDNWVWGILSGVIIGVVVFVITYVIPKVDKKMKRNRERKEQLKKYDPVRCVLHGEELKIMHDKVDDITIIAELTARGMYELLTKEKFGKVNGSFNDIYDEFVKRIVKPTK